MDVKSALTFAFQDRDWAAKLVGMLVATGAAFLFTPLLVGFGIWALLLGYQAELIYNVQNLVPAPLPAWDNLGNKLSRGATVLLALVVYNLPNLLLACCSSLTASSFNLFMGDTVGTLLSICCLFPLLLIYNALIWPMLTLGTARYNVLHDIAAYFNFSELFSLIRTHGRETLGYLGSVLLVYLLFAILGITLIGNVVTLAIAVPVMGHLGGQYALKVLGKPKRANMVVDPLMRR